MAELLVLDPAEETPDRVEVDITQFVGPQGPDFGEGSIAPYYAESRLGRTPIDFTIPNRIVTIPLVVRPATGVTFDELRSTLQAKVGLWQREGGVLMRETDIGPVYADVVSATLRFGGSTAQAMLETDADAVLTLECIPDWYGAWIDLADEEGAGDVVRVLQPERGDHPGRVRIVVTDDEGAPRLGLIWGIRSRYYDSDPTAALVHEAEDLTPAAGAAIATVSGASGGGSNNVVRHPSITNRWTPILSTDIDGVGPMAHRGTYRVWARVYTTSATEVRLRLAWDVGDFTTPVTNPAAAIPNPGQFFLVDLGEVIVFPAPAGSHQWRGQVDAYGASGGENVHIDKLWCVPLDEYAGMLRAPEPDLATSDYLRGGLYEYDGFDQSSGALATNTLPSGQTWGGAGSATDFQVGSSRITRTAASDAAWAGRYAYDPSLLFRAVSVETVIAAPPVDTTTLAAGVLARYVDTSNWLMGLLDYQTGTLKVVKRVAGAVTTLASTTVAYTAGGVTLQLNILASGDYRLLCTSATGVHLPVALEGSDADLVANAVLGLGAAGVYAEKRSGGSVAVSLDDFKVWIPNTDAVIHATRALQLATDGAIRENGSDTGYGPVAWVTGDLPRLPAPGLESREVELLVITSRGDLGQLPDAAADDAFTVAVQYRPSYLYVPDGGPGS